MVGNSTLGRVILGWARSKILVTAFVAVFPLLTAAPLVADTTTLRVGFPVAAATGGYPFARDDGGGVGFLGGDALQLRDEI